MPLDPLDPSALDTGGGFDLSSLLGAQQPPAQAPPQLPQAKPQNKWAQVALAALVPIAAKKGGRTAVAALLNGMQQEQARRQAEEQQQGQQQFQNQRLLQGDQRANAATDWNQRQERAQLLGQQDTRRAALMKEAVAAVQQADSPETVKALLDFYNPQLTQAGVRNPQALNSLASQIATPSAMEQKAATKYIGQLEKTYGQDWASKVGSATFVLPGAPPDPATGKPKAITAQELLAKSGLNMQGLPVKPPTNQVNAGSFEDYVIRYAKDVGKTPETLTTQDIQAARKQYNQADDKGADPTLQAIRELTLQQKQAAANGSGGLNPRQQTQVSAQARTFEGLPVVKNTQKMSEAVAFANSMDPNTKNPADDQALIYAFAKAMDPDSVVREGEYATVQKYSQSWLSAFGFNAMRIVSNTEFLTPEARANLKRTIQQKFKAATAQYKAVRDSYVKKINKITGLTDGEDWLTDYGAAFPSDAPAGGGRVGLTYQDYLKSRGPK